MPHTVALRIKQVIGGLILVGCSLSSLAFGQNPRVLLETTKGDIEVELFEKEAPVTVANFLSYVKKGHYDGTIFHRVIDSFVVQGGGMTPDMKEKPTDDPIQNEAGNGLKNERMTLSMARTPAPHSATSQFYINLKYNKPLDRKYSQDNYGYCVFGKVVKGEEIVDQIAKVKTGRVKGNSDVPLEPITLKRAMILEGAAAGSDTPKDADKKDK